ncbi:MAG: hypothetical protein ACK5HS_05245 [Mycoplasmatales bacterium]
MIKKIDWDFHALVLYYNSDDYKIALENGLVSINVIPNKDPIITGKNEVQ